MSKLGDAIGRVIIGQKRFELLKKLDAQDIIGRLDGLDNLLLGGRTSSGATVNEDTAMRYSAVYTAVRILSEVIAMLPCHLKMIDDTTADTSKNAVDHPTFNVLYRQPNRWQSAFEFWRHVMVCLLLRGNFFGLITRDGNNRAVEIVPINPDRLKITMLPNYSLEYEYTPARGNPFTIPEGEILHFRALGADGILGKGVIQQARESIGIGIQSEVHAAKMFVNGARLGLILKHPEVVGEETSVRLKESFDKAYAGIENSHKTILLEEGMTVEKISMTAEDAQFIEQRKFQRSEVLAMFGIPPHMAGDTEKTTSWGTGIEQQTIGFVTFVLMPWLVNFEQGLWRDVLTRKEKKQYFAKFNSDAIIRGDLLSRYKAHEIGLKNKFLVINEVRSMENRNPVAWGDEPDPNAKPDDKPAPDDSNTPDGSPEKP